MPLNNCPRRKLGYDSREYERRRRRFKKYNGCPHLLSRGGYDLLDKKLMDEKRKHQEHLAEFIENPSLGIDPPSPVSRHLKWKMAHTKPYGQMTSAAAQQISDEIDSLEE
ncbi:uncharacterized protein LOC114395018 [Glycine soja]|uniref:uncharacterized protein LOC114395018 n=1 Tax=Glycine soja TaxID=3848 RepID=UPI00103F825D|nr:uncharacterized protein LOC114395018 [Glycine soja]